MKQASGFVRPGGELIYVTCSVLPQENEEQVRRFTAENPEFSDRQRPARLGQPVRQGCAASTLFRRPDGHADAGLDRYGRLLLLPDAAKGLAS